LRRIDTVVALLIVAALAACGDGTDTSTPATNTTTTTMPVAARLCSGSQPRQTGALPGAGLNEVSGLVASRTNAGVLWAHNDSGNAPRVFAIDTNGGLRATVTVNGAPLVDWEAIAIDGETLYVGDIGDNQRVRPAIALARVPEPALTATRVTATAFEVRYPDGPHDAEAMMIDPVNDRIVIVTKEFGGNSAVYSTPLDAPGTLQLDTQLELGPGELVTAGDISTRGDTIVLRTYSHVLVWSRHGDESLAAAFAREPCAAPAPADLQGEALALMPPDERFVTTSEGAGSPLWEVVAAPAEPASTP
jgi:hypothetical protein